MSKVTSIGTALKKEHDTVEGMADQIKKINAETPVTGMVVFAMMEGEGQFCIMSYFAAHPDLVGFIEAQMTGIKLELLENIHNAMEEFDIHEE